MSVIGKIRLSEGTSCFLIKIKNLRTNFCKIKKICNSPTEYIYDFTTTFRIKPIIRRLVITMEEEFVLCQAGNEFLHSIFKGFSCIIKNYLH